MSDAVIKNAMEIILNAGDARLACKEALDALANSDVDASKAKLHDAQKKITEAHKVQTDAIQEETRGSHSEYSLLFAHAQDTLMTVYSEINIAKQLIKIYESLDARLLAIEGK